MNIIFIYKYKRILRSRNVIHVESALVVVNLRKFVLVAQFLHIR